MMVRSFSRTELDACTDSLKKHGYHVFKTVVGTSDTDALRTQVLQAIELERIQLGHRERELYGRLTLACMYGGPLLDLLNHDALFVPVDEVFGEPCLVYTMTTSCIGPGTDNYTARIHRDTRHVGTTVPLNLGIMLLLDDFNQANGATEFMPASFEVPEPDLATFEAKAVRLVADAGDLVLFDTRLWHRSGQNSTDKWRSCILFSMVRPWMQQRFDMQGMMSGTDCSVLKPSAKKRLGLIGRPPASISGFLSGPVSS